MKDKVAWMKDAHEREVLKLHNKVKMLNYKLNKSSNEVEEWWLAMDEREQEHQLEKNLFMKKTKMEKKW